MSVSQIWNRPAMAVLIDLRQWGQVYLHCSSVDFQFFKLTRVTVGKRAHYKYLHIGFLSDQTWFIKPWKNSIFKRVLWINKSLTQSHVKNAISERWPSQGDFAIKVHSFSFSVYLWEVWELKYVYAVTYGPESIKLLGSHLESYVFNFWSWVPF